MNNPLNRPGNPLKGLVLLRVWMGIWFAGSGIFKLNASYYDKMEATLRFFADKGAFPLYKPFLLKLSENYADPTAIITSFGELITGLALLSGVASKRVCAVVIFICFNYLLATFNFGPQMVGFNLTFILISAVYIIYAPTRRNRIAGILPGKPKGPSEK